MKDYFRLLKFLKPHGTLFGIATLTMLLSAVFDGVTLTMLLPLADKVLTNKRVVLPARLPSFLTDIVDKINNTAPQALLNYLAVTLVILFVFKGIFLFLQGYLMNDVSQRVVTDLRCKLYAKMQNLSLDYFSHQRGGELMSRITNDVIQVGTVISSGLVDLIYQSLQVVVFASLILFIHVRLAIVALIILPLISFPIVKISKVLKKIFKRGQEKMADINSILYETILGARVVKAFNAEAYEQAKFNAANRDYYKLYMKSTKRVLMSGPLVETIAMFAAVFVFVWQGREVISGRISFGVLGVSLAALLSMVRPFRRLSQVNGMIQLAIASSVRIHEVLDSEPTVKERTDARVLDGFRESLVFDDVWFSYGANEVLKGISFKVRVGEVMAIVGPSGWNHGC
jgi:subfamily B ATP-binding cassette protein MsbA